MLGRGPLFSGGEPVTVGEKGSGDWQEAGTLVPALVGVREPPSGFRAFQASDLTGWNGRSDAEGLTEIVRAVTMRGGGRKSVTLWPLGLFIVVGWRKTWPALGATTNMNTRFVNELERAISVRWLEASAAGPHGLRYHFAWKVPYDKVGPTEHRWRPQPDPAIDVPPGQTEQGIQLQAPAFSKTVAWPSGHYSFDVLAWTGHKREEPANLRTQFQASVSDDEASQVKWLMEADDATWATLKASDDAMGVEVTIVEVRAGLPTV